VPIAPFDEARELTSRGGVAGETENAALCTGNSHRHDHRGRRRLDGRRDEQSTENARNGPSRTFGHDRTWRGAPAGNKSGGV